MGCTFRSSTLAIPQWKLTAFSISLFSLNLLCGFLIAMICVDIQAENTVFGGTHCDIAMRTTYLIVFMTVIMVSDVLLCFVINFVMVQKLLTLVSVKLASNVSAALRDSISKHGDFTKKCVTQFHGNTSDDNRILLLSTKLSILNYLAAVSSVLCVLTFVYFSRTGLAIDTFFNVVIVWLGFNFTTPWFYRFQCGRWMKFWYAVSKTMAWSGSYAVLCCASCRQSNEEQTMTDIADEVDVESVGTPSGETQCPPSPSLSHQTSGCQPVEPPRRGCCDLCCCTAEASNLYRISSREWDMFPEKMRISA